jgi:hypothetical protein
MEPEARIRFAIDNTIVLRPPSQKLSTFGTTNVYYYMITELMQDVSVVREGRVIAAKPKIVTPAYLVNTEGFSNHARHYLQMMAELNPDEPGILYSYKNETAQMNIVSQPFPDLVDKINREIDGRNDPLSSIVKGVEEMWDVSLIKFTFELTSRSVHHNYSEFQGSGRFYLNEGGIPQDALASIEELFALAARDPSRAPELANELHRWNLWNVYQDRFLQIFRKR